MQINALRYTAHCDIAYVYITVVYIFMCNGDSGKTSVRP